jgi:hypothetical protein
MMNLKDWDKKYLYSSAILIIYFAVMLFSNLGRYSFWDDESNTAIYGKSFFESGSLSAKVGKNILIHRNGIEVDDNFNNKIVPPVGYIASGLTSKIFGQSNFGFRMAFALSTFGMILLIILWIRRESLDEGLWTTIFISLSGSIALILFSRQCRYYAVATLLTVAILYFYRFRNNTIKNIVIIGVLASLLLMTHYLIFASLGVLIAIDYLLFGRKEVEFNIKHLIGLVISQVIVIAAVMSKWSPFGVDFVTYKSKNIIIDKLHLFWIHFRDLNSHEYMPIALILVAIGVYFVKKDKLLLRVLIGLVVGIFMTVLFTPQPGNASIADMRYISWMLPICILLGALTIYNLASNKYAKIAIALVCFHTTLVHWPISFIFKGPSTPLRSTTFSYLSEVFSDRLNTYGMVKDWLLKNTKADDIIVTEPTYASSPLMFYLSDRKFGWQVDGKGRFRFRNLDEFHYKGKVNPDYIVVFGPRVKNYQKNNYVVNGQRYKLETTVNAYAQDGTRPEIPFHQFEEKKGFDKSLGVHILKKI